MKSSIPCCYKVLLGGEEVINGRLLDHDSYRDENHFIYFEGMGEEGKGIYYDDIYIHPRNITLTNDGRMVTFRQKVGDQMFKGWCEFVGKMGYGHFEFGLNRGYAVTLRPWAVPYEVQISTGAGAYYSSSGNKLVWDTDSQEWKNAVWESGQMVFAYDVYEKKDPVSGIVKILECRYTDTGVTGTPFWELTENIGYSAEINASNLMTINAINEVPPDPDRKKMPIPSVFPKKFQVQFDDIGLSFQGAYLDDDGKVYAVKGRAQRLISGSYTLDGISTPVSVFGGKLAVDGRVISSSHQAGNRVYWSDMKENTHEFPSSGFLEFSENCDRITGGFASGERMEGILKKPEIAPAVFTSSEGDSLDIYGLIGMNPMKTDSSGNWYDDVGQESMKDFYKIIVNFMDRNLREDFIPVSVPELTPELRQIAYDEPQSSTAFYNKTMQIPYLVRTLSNSTLDQAKYLNGSRAGKQLKQGCANNDVYKRHADKLYRLHWKKTFPNTDTYLEDQETTDYTEKINGNFNYLKDIIHERMKCAVDSDREKRLKDLMDEMDGLNQWALEKNVYWAFILYYHLTIHWIPVLEGKLKDGNLSQDVTQQIKNYSSLFNILEGTESNPKGKTFNEAFLDTIRAFQLATIIPQYVDYTANDDYFSEILGSIFDEFMKQYGNTTDPDLIENVQNVRELLQDRELTRMFVSELATSIRVLGANASWDKIVTTFQGRCQKFLSKVSGVLVKSKIILCSIGIAGFVLVLAEGKFSSLTLSQKAIFISSSVSLFANVLVGISRGIIRLYALWSDFNGFFHGVKVFFGFDGYLAALPSASSKIGNSFAKWFVRSKNEVMQMQQDGDFGKISKIFGRNVNEFMAETMGAALSIITIIFCAIDLANTNDTLTKAMDGLMIASASLQLIATFGGWALVAAGISEGILTSILSCLGPLSAAAAVAGLIIMIIIMSKHEDPPDPLRDFVNTQASNAGLKMPEGMEIDYIDVIPDKGGKSYDGISMRNGNRYLLMKLPESQAVMGDLVHDATSVFFILTDEKGISQLFTYLPDGKGNTVTVYLGVDDQGNAMAKEFPAPPEKQPDGTYKPGEMDAYQKKVRQMHWECKCTGNVSIYKQGDDKSLFFANFSLKNQESQKYLIMDGSSVVTGDVKQDWTLSMEQIGPGALTYHPNPLKIYTDSRDHKLIPSFNICGSSPLTWKITPALDNAFELLTSGDYQGIIRQKPGIAPHEMADTNYKVTVSNTISGALYSSTCDITIHVDRPENTGPSPKKFIVLTPERLRLESVGV